MIFFGVCFGLAYNHFFYPHNLTEYLEAASIGIFLGIILGIAEEFWFYTWFRSIAFYKVLLIRVIIYSLAVSLSLSLVLAIEISFDEQITYFEALVFYLKTPLFERDYLFSLGFVFLIIFSTQLVQLIGVKNLIRLIFGLYHKPREVSRVFMFIDLNQSTALAERLDNERYSFFIKEFFNDVSDAINMYGGEIYQYVGDEVSAVWPGRARYNDALNCFFKAKSIIESKKEYYLSKFDAVPTFKAGVHTGKVIVTEVGKMKMELVYHGDVVNTTSRIIGKCNELEQELLISGDLLNLVDQSSLNAIDQGPLPLKGKKDPIHLFGIHHH